MSEPGCGGRGDRRIPVVDHGERRVGEGVVRHRRQAQQPAERARYVRPEHRRQPHESDRYVAQRADVTSDAFHLGQLTPERTRRVERTPFVGAAQRTLRPSVDLDPGTDHDGVERRALGGCAEHVERSGLAPCRRLGRRRPGVRLVHPEVDDHVGIDLRDQLDDPRAIPWIHPVELGSVEAAPRRVDVDADELRDPGLLLESRCHERAELASHSAHDHPPLLHQPETYPSSSHAG